MNRRILLSILVLALGGCVREGFRPVATARDLGTDTLRCDDAEVFALESTDWGRDPLMPTGSSVYRVAGCGQQAFFACSGVGVRGGQCNELPLGPYRSPGRGEPHAALITEVRSSVPAPAGLREMLVIDQDGWVFRRGEPSAPAIPIRAGTLELGLGAEPMRVHTVHHSIPRSSTSYSYSTDYRGRTVRESTTEYWTEHYTTQHLVSDEGCTRGFQLSARPGMTYRVTLDLQGVNQCELACTQETVVGGRLIRSTCEGFSPS
jgi:hypothetical protein